MKEETGKVGLKLNIQEKKKEYMLGYNFSFPLCGLFGTSIKAWGFTKASLPHKAGFVLQCLPLVHFVTAKLFPWFFNFLVTVFYL